MFGYQILSAHRYSTHCEAEGGRVSDRCYHYRDDDTAAEPPSPREAAHLDREVAAVDVVAEEEVARICRVAADLEQLHQVELRGGRGDGV